MKYIYMYKYQFLQVAYTYSMQQFVYNWIADDKLL